MQDGGLVPGPSGGAPGGVLPARAEPGSGGVPVLHFKFYQHTGNLNLNFKLNVSQLEHDPGHWHPPVVVILSLAVPMFRLSWWL